MNTLVKESVNEFVSRFGQISDALLRTINFDIKRGHVTIDIDIEDKKATESWVCLHLYLQNVKIFKYDVESYSSIPVALINAIAIGVFTHDAYGELFYLDLMPEYFETTDDLDRLDELTAEDYLKSCIVVAAETISWELLPLTQ